MSDPRIVNVAVNHLSAEMARFVVATFDAASWRALSLDQFMRFREMLKRMHVDGARLAVIVACWDSLSARERSDLVVQTHEFQIARHREPSRVPRRSARPRRINPGLRLVTGSVNEGCAR